MKVHVKIFPIAGLCNQSQKLELALEEGHFSEMLMCLQGRLGANLDNNPDDCSGDGFDKFEKLMFMHNGRALGKCKDVVFQDGDQLWLLPLLSGG